MKTIVELLLSKYSLSDFKTRRKALVLSMLSFILLLLNASFFLVDNLSNGANSLKGIVQILMLAFILIVFLVTYNRLLKFGVVTFLLYVLLFFIYLHIIELYWLMIIVLPFFLLIISIIKTSFYQLASYTGVLVGNLIYLFINENRIFTDRLEFHYAFFYVLIFSVLIFFFVQRVEKEIERSHEIIDKSTVDFILKSNNRRQIDKAVVKENLKETISVLMIGLNKVGTVIEDLDDEDKDKLLKEVMNTIRSTVRLDDYIIRWGQTDFLVLLHYTPLSNSGIVAEKIRRAIEFKSFLGKSKRLTITVCATAKNEELGIQEAIERAVKALETYKEEKENIVVFP